MQFCQNQLILYRDTANFGSFLFVVLCYQERTEIMKQICANPIYHPHHTQIQGANPTKDYLQVENNRRTDNDNRRTKAISGSLEVLPFCGSSIKDFAEQINVKPHTLYNYICGQYPSDKYHRFILYTLEKEYPNAIETAKSIIQRG